VPRDPRSGEGVADVIGLMELRRLAAVRKAWRSVRIPTRLASLVKFEEAASHRSLSCSGHDACLGEALRRGWPSWTCRSCSRFAQRSDLRAIEVAHQAARRNDRDADTYALPRSARQA